MIIQSLQGARFRNENPQAGMRLVDGAHFSGVALAAVWSVDFPEAGIDCGLRSFYQRRQLRAVGFNNSGFIRPLPCVAWCQVHNAMNLPRCVHGLRAPSCATTSRASSRGGTGHLGLPLDV